MGALKDSKQFTEFMNAFEYAQRGTGVRSVLGRLKFLHRDEKWWSACQQVTDYADRYVDTALKRLKEERTHGKTSQPKERLRLVDEMARDTQDRVTLRSHIISVFSPAHDGAATALTNVIFHLARHPDVWWKLKTEIESTKEEILTFELLNSYQYLEWVLKESECFRVAQQGMLYILTGKSPSFDNHRYDQPTTVRKVHRCTVWWRPRRTFSNVHSERRHC